MIENSCELILHLGVEGGGVRVFRHSTAVKVCTYSFETSCMSLSEFEDFGDLPTEPETSVNSERFESFEEVIAHLTKRHRWIFFTPVSAHRDYRNAIWEMREVAISSLPSERGRARAQRSCRQWARICRRENQVDSTTSRSPLTSLEIVLQLDGEGGRVEILRGQDEGQNVRFYSRTIGSGGIDCSVEEGKVSVDNNAERSETLSSHATLDLAIEAWGLSGLWVCLEPITANSGYRQQIWELRQRTIKHTGKDLRDAAEMCEFAWRKACGME